MRAIRVATIVLGLLAKLSLSQSSDEPADYQCTPETAMPFGTLSFPLPSPEGEGVLSVVASIIDHVVISGRDAAAAPSPNVTCTTHEVCVATYANTIFCYDSILSRFHDALNTTGSVVSGNYALADGQEGNAYQGPHPTEVVVGGDPQPTEVRVMTGGGNGTQDSSTEAVDRTGDAGRIRARATVGVAVGMVATVLGGMI